MNCGRCNQEVNPPRWHNLCNDCLRTDIRENDLKNYKIIDNLLALPKEELRKKLFDIMTNYGSWYIDDTDDIADTIKGRK